MPKKAHITFFHPQNDKFSVTCELKLNLTKLLLKEKISIENFEDKKFKIRLIESESLSKLKTELKKLDVEWN